MTINGLDRKKNLSESETLEALVPSVPRLSEDWELVRAFLEIKKACAQANCTVGNLTQSKRDAIVAACDALLNVGKAKELQTEKNAPLNAIATRIDQLILSKVEGFDRGELDLCQSFNDVLLSAQSIAIYRHATLALTEVRALEDALEEKAVSFAAATRCGRIGQRDSVPMTFGQVIAGWKASVMRARKHIEMLLPELLELVLGGTVLGTGLGASLEYRKAAYDALTTITKLAVVPAKEESAITDSAFFGLYQSHGRLLALMGAVKELGYAVGKIANDLYVFSSGPRTGYREFTLPAIAPGSSIMPGKLNPLMPELVLQVMQQVFANDTELSLLSNDLSLDADTFASDAYASVAESLTLLKGAMHQFTALCVKGLGINAEFCAARAKESLALSHVVEMLFGAETEKQVREKAIQTGKRIEVICVEEKLLSEKDAIELFSPLSLADVKTSAQLLAAFKTQYSKD